MFKFCKTIVSLFESKYSRFITNNTTRFAEDDEITENLVGIESGSGVPLFESSGTIMVDNGDTHSIVVGPTGCGKSRAVCKTLITSIISQGESFLVNDPNRREKQTQKVQWTELHFLRKESEWLHERDYGN